MKRYLACLLGAAVLMVLLAAACGGDEGQPSPAATASPTSTPTGPPFAFEGPVGIDLSTYGIFFQQGQPISFTITIAAAEPITLYYRTTQRYDIVVADSQGNEVWRWSKDRSFGQTLEQVTLTAGETLTFNENWDQLGNDGQPVPPGNYQSTATSTHCDANYENCGQLSVSRTLQIRAP